jgi:hypothetical protein
MTGNSLHIQWPLTSQLHDRHLQNLKSCENDQQSEAEIKQKHNKTRSNEQTKNTFKMQNEINKTYKQKVNTEAWQKSLKLPHAPGCRYI